MQYDQIQEAVTHIQKFTDFSPRFGIILGTGLGNLTDAIDVVAEIAYSEIPHFPVSTVKSHKGKLVFGHFGGQAIVAMAGRFHYYEGYSMQQIAFPVRVLKYLGIERLFISSAVGSTNPNIHMGDIVFIRDHINMQPDNPLRGKNDERLGPRFPDMLHAYDKDMIFQALEIARTNNIKAHTGVYVALAGPNLETPSEYVFLHRIGGDVVGMSTVPEVLAAKHIDLPIFVLSAVSNQCYPPELIRETSAEDVIAMAGEVEPKMRLIVKELMNT